MGSSRLRRVTLAQPAASTSYQPPEKQLGAQPADRRWRCDGPDGAFGDFAGVVYVPAEGRLSHSLPCTRLHLILSNESVHCPTDEVVRNAGL